MGDVPSVARAVENAGLPPVTATYLQETFTADTGARRKTLSTPYAATSARPASPTRSPTGCCWCPTPPGSTPAPRGSTSSGPRAPTWSTHADVVDPRRRGRPTTTRGSPRGPARTSMDADRHRHRRLRASPAWDQAVVALDLGVRWGRMPRRAQDVDHGRSGGDFPRVGRGAVVRRDRSKDRPGRFVISREVTRHGGRGGYRAVDADEVAGAVRARPKRLAVERSPRLRAVVGRQLRAGWSPGSIAGPAGDRLPRRSGLSGVS